MDMNVVYTIVISCALSSSDKMEINNHNVEEYLHLGNASYTLMYEDDIKKKRKKKKKLAEKGKKKKKGFFSKVFGSK